MTSSQSITTVTNPTAAPAAPSAAVPIPPDPLPPWPNALLAGKYLDVAMHCVLLWLLLNGTELSGFQRVSAVTILPFALPAALRISFSLDDWIADRCGTSYTTAAVRDNRQLREMRLFTKVVTVAITFSSFVACIAMIESVSTTTKWLWLLVECWYLKKLFPSMESLVLFLPSLPFSSSSSCPFLNTPCFVSEAQFSQFRLRSLVAPKPQK